MKNHKKPKIILYDSYVQTIKNSVGSNLFRNLYLLINRKKLDVLEDGNLSCAKFVSSILYLFKLIGDLHTTVRGTVADLKKSDWSEKPKPKIGSIIVWEERKSKSGLLHKHIGFYIGKRQAISNRYEKRQPMKHHWTYGTDKGRPVRKIEQIFWNKKLDKF